MIPEKDFRAMTDAEKIAVCEKILSGYPDGHPDKIKGERMIEAWSGKKSEN